MKRKHIILVLLCMPLSIQAGQISLSSGMTQIPVRLSYTAHWPGEPSYPLNHSAVVSLISKQAVFPTFNKIEDKTDESGSGAKFTCTYSSSSNRIVLYLDITDRGDKKKKFNGNCDFNGYRLPVKSGMNDFEFSANQNTAIGFGGAGLNINATGYNILLGESYGISNDSKPIVYNYNDVAASEWVGEYPDSIVLDVVDGTEKQAKLLSSNSSNRVHANVEIDVTGDESLKKSIRMARQDGKLCSEGLSGGDECILYANNQYLPNGIAKGNINIKISVP